MGSLNPPTSLAMAASRVHAITRDMVAYMDQQRWLAQYNEQSWRVVNKWAQSPARKRGELRAIAQRQDRARATYRMIERNQRMIGFWSQEGDHYG